MSKLTEPIMQNIIRILSASTPAVLQKIDAEYQSIDTTNPPATSSVRVPLPPFKAFYFGQRLTAPQFPCVIVDFAPVNIDPERFHFQWADYDHTIMVAILVQGDNEDVIARQLLRYARCVWEVMFGNQVDLVGNQVAAISLRPVRGGPSPIVPKDNQLSRAYAWAFEVHRYDDLT